ncbi:butyrophilin subfamily 1 member A1-like [Scleropages formosus]|uniref:butyrophilin subfamily 1 member A1-like n=1 Tax=Scleropages formosus TaxID=113540 RepID=UPI0010FAC0B6|nr:butyrophilin subfamily 1 member A1-like [Scleropages formosus]XP_029108183.1 butyrophilin subfamily 1 member A1-like [Scleropages formosus]
MWSSVLIVLLGLQVHGATDGFAVVTPQTPVSGPLGGSATLPCWLSPAISAEALEVRWYRPNKFTSPVLLYREQKVQQSSQDPQYEGRVSLGSRGSTNRALNEGNVSLHLENVTLSDSGQYECYVSSDKTYESKTVTLEVNVLGMPPMMSSLPADDGVLNVSCASSGWHPKPAVVWSDRERPVLPPGGVQHEEDGDGLLSVHSWILASPSRFDWLSCKVSLSDKWEREGRLSVRDSSYNCPDTSLPWRAAFLCTLLLAIVISLVYLFRKKIFSSKLFGTTPSAAQPEEEKLLRDKYENAKVDITLNSNACHSFLKLSSDGKIVRDSGENLPPCGYLDEMYVLGEPSFSSGCAYWEVLLKLPNTKVKEFWGVGVALKNAERPSDGQLSCSKGFWVLSLQDGKLCVNTEPRVVIPVDQGPQTLGVFLDYDSGELSFRDAEKNKDLVTLSAKFSEPVYPLFNPGIGDESALKISTEVTEKPATANLQTKEKIQNSAV